MTMISNEEKVFIVDEFSIVNARYAVTNRVKNLGFGTVDQTKIITATSELTRNIIRYAGRGFVLIENISDGKRKGVRLSFEDNGPGIADLELAMKDGYSSSNGMGLGLPGAKRLVDEFQICSQPGKGTKIVIAKWIR